MTGARAPALLLCLALAAASMACTTRPPPLLSFAPDTLPDATLGVPYSAVITISGNQTPFGDISAGPGLPLGLVLSWDENGDRNKAELSGTPASAATYAFTISAWCLGTNVSGQFGSHDYTIVVNSPSAPSAT